MKKKMVPIGLGKDLTPNKAPGRLNQCQLIIIDAPLDNIHLKCRHDTNTFTKENALKGSFCGVAAVLVQW